MHINIVMDIIDKTFNELNRTEKLIDLSTSHIFFQYDSILFYLFEGSNNKKLDEHKYLQTSRSVRLVVILRALVGSRCKTRNQISSTTFN